MEKKRAHPVDRVIQMDPSLAEEVTRRSGAFPKRCFSCLSCSGGCPFFAAMDIGPHGVMRRVVMGYRDEAINNTTIWLCVGCHTCSAACPMAIDIVAVMDTLRVMALEEGVPCPEPGILEFHRQVLHSIERHGRTHQLEIMLRYKFQQGGWFDDVNVGFRMLGKRKLDLRPSKIADPGELSRLFTKPWQQ